MTSLDSKLRAFIYVTIAVLAFAGGGVSALPLTEDAKIWTGFTIGTVASGLVALRAYLDQSSSMVKPAEPTPEPEKKPYQNL